MEEIKELVIDPSKLSDEEQVEYYEHYLKSDDYDFLRGLLKIVAPVTTLSGGALASAIALNPELVDVALKAEDKGMVGAAATLLGVGVLSSIGALVCNHKYKVESARYSTYKKDLLIKHGSDILVEKTK